MESLAANHHDTKPLLLPSALPRDDSFSPHAEGYEGNRLHELFLSARQHDTHLRSDRSPTRPDVEVIENSTQAPSSDLIGTKPFFVMVEDTTTGEQYHPHVHYVFSDDDSSSLAHAALQAIDMTGSEAGARVDDVGAMSQPEASTELTDCTVIVNMAADSRTVTSAHSLSHIWQVTETSVDRAPVFDTEEREGGSGNMLKIVGTQQYERRDQLAHLPSSGIEGYKESMLKSVERLTREFENSMAELRRLTAASDPEL